jgi:hypothetical protein
MLNSLKPGGLVHLRNLIDVRKAARVYAFRLPAYCPSEKTLKLKSALPFRLCILAFAITLSAISSVAIGAPVPEKLKPEEIIAKHLEAIGTADVRKAITGYLITGDIQFDFYSRGKGSAQGKAVLASNGVKTLVGMGFASNNYRQENFAFDGKDVTTSFINPGERSNLGYFLYANRGIVKDGLVGGALSTGWALLDMTAREAKLENGGIKKIDGVEAYLVRYISKKGSDLEIRLYFDAATFQHIRSEYEGVVSAQMGPSIDKSAEQSASRYKLIERFSDFRKEGAVTLPHAYKIEYTYDGKTNSIRYVWDLSLQKFVFNQPFAPESFNLDASTAK